MTSPSSRVALPRIVEPGGVVELELEFEAQLPRIIARTGFVGDFHLVGQWFPKLAVFEGESGWNSHQFHATSEFFADFGSYEVTITIPEEWVIGASGIEVRSDTAGCGSTDRHLPGRAGPRFCLVHGAPRSDGGRGDRLRAGARRAGAVVGKGERTCSIWVPPISSFHPCGCG